MHEHDIIEFENIILGNGLYKNNSTVCMRDAFNKVINYIKLVDYNEYKLISKDIGADRLDILSYELVQDVFCKRIINISHWPMSDDTPEYKNLFVTKMENHGFILLG